MNPQQQQQTSLQRLAQAMAAASPARRQEVLRRMQRRAESTALFNSVLEELNQAMANIPHVQAAINAGTLPATAQKIPLNDDTVDRATDLIDGGYRAPRPIQPINPHGQVINPVAYGVVICDTFDLFSNLGEMEMGLPAEVDNYANYLPGDLFLKMSEEDEKRFKCEVDFQEAYEQRVKDIAHQVQGCYIPTVDRLRNERNNLQAANNAIQNQLNDIQTENTEINRLAFENRRENRDLSNGVVTLRNQLNSKNEVIRTMKAEMSDCKMECFNKDAEILKLREELKKKDELLLKCVQ